MPSSLMPNWETGACGGGMGTNRRDRALGLEWHCWSILPTVPSATALMNSWVRQRPVKDYNQQDKGALVLRKQRNFKSKVVTL